MKTDKIQVQPFDCMNYFYHTVQEQFIRQLTRFDGHLDIGALKRAVDLSIRSVPLLSCCFNTKTHRWQERNFTADDIVHVVEVQSREENSCEQLLLSAIVFSREPQLKIFLVKGPDCDTLCVIINHMVCDGAGFKDYLYLLSDFYSKYKRNPTYSDIPPRKTDRSLRQLLRNLSRKEKLEILCSKSDTPKLDASLILPLEGGNGHPFLALRRIEPQSFRKLKGYAKNNHVSLNDVLLTAYMRALHHITGRERITVPCPVDLRKYVLPNQECGICHLTGNYICKALVRDGDGFADTLKQVSTQTRAQKNSKGCLKGPMLLHLLYPILPFRAVRKLFTVPVTSYTNLGVLQPESFHFEGLTVCDAFFATAVKHAPYFQVSVSTYDDCCTLTSSSRSSLEDQKVIENLLDYMQTEILSLF